MIIHMFHILRAGLTTLNFSGVIPSLPIPSIGTEAQALEQPFSQCRILYVVHRVYCTQCARLSVHTAKTQYRKLETISCACELFIYSQDWSAYLL